MIIAFAEISSVQLRTYCAVLEIIGPLLATDYTTAYDT